jgi:probable HAF family extracellular repeat protein
MGPTTEPVLSSASATAATYSVRSLGSLGGRFSSARAINDANVVVGSSTIRGDAEIHAFVWKNGVITDLGTLTGGKESAAFDVNGDGVIVGWSRNRAGDMKAMRWMNGNKRNLGTLGGRNSQALAISPTGVIVGWSEVASGHRHAFRWENGVMTDLGTLGGLSSGASDINRGGAIVGSSQTASGETHAFRWKDGVFTDLGTQGTQFSQATAINSSGQIGGITGPSPDAEGQDLDTVNGFIFYRDVWTRGIGTHFPTNILADISPTGIAVGYSEEPSFNDYPDYAEKPWVWENGTTAELPRLAPGHSHAYGINRLGNIVGFGTNATGQFRATLWRRQ